MWITRDKDYTLNIYRNKPIKKPNHNHWVGDRIAFIIPRILFPNVRWEDEEPTEIPDDTKLTFPITKSYELFYKRFKKN